MKIHEYSDYFIESQVLYYSKLARDTAHHTREYQTICQTLRGYEIEQNRRMRAKQST